jgi:hypothetical protein
LAPTPAAGNQGSNFLCNAHSADIFESLLLHVLFLTEITAPSKSQSCEFQDRVFLFWLVCNYIAAENEVKLAALIH